MATLNEIKTRIQGVKSTQKITSAMKVVATTRLKKLEMSLNERRIFQECLKGIFQDLAAAKESLSHPLLKKNTSKKKLGVIIIASDRGLCGSFNSLLFKSYEEELVKDYKDFKKTYFLIGAKAEQYFAKKNVDVHLTKSKLSNEDSSEFVELIIQQVTNLYIANKLSDVVILFNGYRSKSDFGYTVERVLPMSTESILADGEYKKSGSSFLVEPDIEVCLEYLVPLYLRTLFMNALMQSQTAEEFSRMMAMDYATENANELIGDLTLEYNRRRQEVITKEISEIVGGAEALN